MVQSNRTRIWQMLPTIHKLMLECTDGGFSGKDVTLFWSLLGLASVGAAFVWGPIHGRLRGGRGAGCRHRCRHGRGCGAAVMEGNGRRLYSAILFGGSFLTVAAGMTSFARRAFKAHAWTAAIALLTADFGIGQCVGPILKGP